MIKICLYDLFQSFTNKFKKKLQSHLVKNFNGNALAITTNNHVSSKNANQKTVED